MPHQRRETLSACLAILARWKHQQSADYARGLIERFGVPHHCMFNSVHWYKPRGMTNILEVKVMDERIRHTHPAAHWDFVYSTAKIPVHRCEHACALAAASGSIIVDQLKGEVTARCGGLGKNQVTLSFADDVCKGRLDHKLTPSLIRGEYARRITGDIAGRRFPLSRS